MVKVFQAVEAHVHPDRYYGFIPKTDCLPVVFGTPDYNRQLREALAAAETVKLDPTRPPKLTTATPPEKLQEDLFRRLRLIAICSQTHEQISKLKGTGASPENLKAVVEEARKLTESLIDDPDRDSLITQLTRATTAK